MPAHRLLRRTPHDAAQRDALPERCSLAFAPAFYGWPYYAGVAAYLQRHGKIHRDARLIGTSAGVAIAAFLACGVDILEQGLPASLRANDAQVAGHRTPFFHPTSVLRTFFEHFAAAFPPDAHERASGRLMAIVTMLPSMRARPVTHFATRDALLDAIAASMAVPGHGVRLAYRARAAQLGWCIDGAIGLGRPCDDRPGWRTIHIGVRRGRYLLPRRLDLEPSRPMPLRSMLAVESRERRMRWVQLGWDDASRYFGAP